MQYSGNFAKNDELMDFLYVKLENWLLMRWANISENTHNKEAKILKIFWQKLPSGLDMLARS
jgi:hypothetical protein